MLESRYTIRTDDRINILVDAKGLASLDPSDSRADEAKPAGSRDRPQNFSRLTYSAPTSSPYDWMNSIVALGVMTTWDGKIVNDAYRVDTLSLEDARDLLAAQKGKETGDTQK